MTALTQTQEKLHLHPYELRHVPALAPFDWLAKAWSDLLQHPAASLAYGALITLFGGLLLGYPRHPFVVAGLITGFMLVGPVLAAGLCALSRARSEGLPQGFEHSLRTLHESRRPLLRFAGLLAALALAWFAVSSLLLQQFFGSVGPSLSHTLMGDVLRHIEPMQLVAYTAIGGALAAAVFVLSAVTVPLILDRNARVRNAMLTSVKSVLAADLPAMLVWACLCVLLIALAFATFLLGMVVIFPLLGHATWYAYLDLVK
ncbi:MAG: DUF2189 domain-containing protein [Pseudomonadales bacterium]|nr:DUF2189 domain-containing protein [Pseudomonadales bacterium]